MHQPGNQTGPIEGKFVNNRVLLGLFMQLCKFTLTVLFNTLVSLGIKI